MTLDVNVDSDKIELEIINTCYNCKNFMRHWEPSDGYYCDRARYSSDIEPNNKCKYWSESYE